nr:MAG TPA: hypothetical protein [Caudoviricetes sp.]
MIEEMELRAGKIKEKLEKGEDLNEDEFVFCDGNKNFFQKVRFKKVRKAKIKRKEVK